MTRRETDLRRRLALALELLDEGERARARLPGCERDLAAHRVELLRCDRERDQLRLELAAAQEAVTRLTSERDRYQAAAAGHPLEVAAQREHLPDTRPIGVCWKLRIGAGEHTVECYIHVNCFADGRVGELWLKFALGQHFISAALADGMCIMASLALQYGVPLADVVGKMIGAVDDSGGVTRVRIDHGDGTETWGPDPEVPMCQSLRDYIGKKIRKNVDEHGHWIGRVGKNAHATD